MYPENGYTSAASAGANKLWAGTVTINPKAVTNASSTESLSCVVVRSAQEPIVVDLAIEPVEKSEEVRWVDPSHPKQ
jgi:uncharacterized RmlC-like cupin family protein